MAYGAVDRSEVLPGLTDGISIDETSEYSDYHCEVKALITEARNYEDLELSPIREENLQYYNGDETAFPADEGTSTFVSTDVRDTVMTILPSLVRIFCSSEKPVLFVPSDESGQEQADQATDYVDYVFKEENEGFLLLYSLFKDALVERTGIVKWWTDFTECPKEVSYSGLSGEQVAFLGQSDPTMEILDGEQLPDGSIDLTVRFVESTPKHFIEAVPPDEFRISPDAKNEDTARLIGHERIVPVSDIVKLGVPFEHARDLVSSNNWFSEERFMRNPGLVGSDFAGRGVLYGEWYVRIDKDGDGIDELRFIVTIGDEYEIIHDEIAEEVNFAIYNGDPIPHTAIGESIAELVKDIQRIKTNMMRKSLDNLADSVRPRTYINETVTNLEDVLNPEQSAVVRTRGSPRDAIYESSTPFVGGQVFDMVDRLDMVRASRTGITEASKGLDPKAMQSTTLSGIDAIISGAQERIELIARIFAETGYKRMFRGLLREITRHPNKKRTIQIRGKWVDVDPSTFDPNMRCRVNPTMGRGSDMNRLSALQYIGEKQEMVLSKYGIKNPVVGPEEYLNTLRDALDIVNIRNHSRYFKPMSPEVLEQIMNAPEEPPAETLLAQAELEKVKASVAKTYAEIESREGTDRMKDDLQRDKMMVDAIAKIVVAEIAAQKAVNEKRAKEVESANTPSYDA